MATRKPCLAVPVSGQLTYEFTAVDTAYTRTD